MAPKINISIERLINEKEAAEILGYSVSALQSWRVKGGGPKFVKPSARNVRYRVGDLMDWVAQHTVSNTSQFQG